MSKTSIERFMCSLDTVENADIVIAGFPYDCTATFRAGSRFAPREIRAYSGQTLETFSFYFGIGLERLVQFGVRSGSREEYLKRQNDPRIVAAESIAQIKDALNEEEKVLREMLICMGS